MNILHKYFAYGILLVTFSIFCGCSKDAAEQKENGNENNTSKTEATKSDIKVYPLISSNKPLGKKAADFVWEQNGKQVTFSEYTKGKYVLLNFWGTWCPPCRREIPDIISVAKDMESKGLVVIGAALERTNSTTEALSGVQDYWSSNGMNYPIVIASEELVNAYGGIQSVPSTFLINDKGEIVNTIVGMRTKADFLAEINKMMKL